MIQGVGSVLARNLISYAGSVENVFRIPLQKLLKIPGIGEVNAHRIKESNVLALAEKELTFIEKNDIKTYFYLDADYPKRFGQCIDAPVVFYYKGNANLDTTKIISIVGTRNATAYGRQICDEFIRDLAAKRYDFVVVSGLAFGIDIQAHKSSLQYGVPTIGVLGHGLNKLYPASHAKTADLMVQNGGLLTDFSTAANIDPRNFVRRNRLIAGLSDACIVVESGAKGGALITAEIAASYNRDVFAFPGRVGDSYSKGCNKMIKTNMAALIENAADFEYLMGWETTSKKPVQQMFFAELSDEEQKIVDIMGRQEKSFIDHICMEMGMTVGKISALLLALEFKGVVDALPGKMYRLR
ncbi:MAG: DNA-processing protein DprA [Prolixibacteraceae bacterium]|nr:DNA-processing protein DprA [Prolixibacteraceae bacterium]